MLCACFVWFVVLCVVSVLVFCRSSGRSRLGISSISVKWGSDLSYPIHLLSILILSTYFLSLHVMLFVYITLAHSTTTYCQMVDTSDDIKGKNTSDQSQQMTSATQLSSEETIAWQSKILEMTADHMARLQKLLIVQALLLQGDIEEAYIKCQEDLAMLPLSLVNKEKPLFTQYQVLSGVGPQKDSATFREDHDQNSGRSNEETSSRNLEEHGS